MTKKTWKIALGVALPWILIMLIYHSILNGGLNSRIFFSTTIGGIFFGFLFAYGMKYLAAKLNKKTLITIDDNEKLIKEGGANHFKGVEGVGGKLALTDKRLIFKSHQYNVQNHEQFFELDRIVSLRNTKTLKFLDNGLMLELENQEVHKFIVEDAQGWVKSIGDQRSTAPQTQG